MAPDTNWAADFAFVRDGTYYCKICVLRVFKEMFPTAVVPERRGRVDDDDDASLHHLCTEGITPADVTALYAAKNDITKASYLWAGTSWNVTVFRGRHLVHKLPNGHALKIADKHGAEYDSWIHTFKKLAKLFPKPAGDPTQPTMEESLAKSKDKMSSDDLLVLAGARTFQPFCFVEDPFFREVFKRAGCTIVTGEGYKKAMVDAGKRWQHEWLQARRDSVADIALDTGSRLTERFLAIMLHVRRPAGVRRTPNDFDEGAVLYELVHDSQLGSADVPADDPRARGRATIANLLPILQDVIEKLRRDYNIFVGSICTDNASNMEGLSLQLGRLDIRCACHGMQFVGRAMGTHLSSVGNAVRAAKDHREANKDVVAVTRIHTTRDQRWLDCVREWRMLLECEDRYQRMKDDATLNAPWAKYTPMSRQRPDRYTQLKAGIEELMPVLLATRMCESDTSDQWSILEALACIGLKATAPGAPARGLGPNFCAELNADVNNIITEKFVTPALVITCYFAQCDRGLYQDTAALKALKELIIGWLRTKAVTELASAITSPAALEQEFLSYHEGRHNVGAHNQAMTRAAYDEYLTTSQFALNCPHLAKVVRSISLRIASEASAERLFYAMRLTFTPERASLWPESVAASVRCLSFARATERAIMLESAKAQARADGDEEWRPNGTPPIVENVRLPNDDAAAAAAADADRCVRSSCASRRVLKSCGRFCAWRSRRRGRPKHSAISRTCSGAPGASARRCSRSQTDRARRSASAAGEATPCSAGEWPTLRRCGVLIAMRFVTRCTGRCR